MEFRGFALSLGASVALALSIPVAGQPQQPPQSEGINARLGEIGQTFRAAKRRAEEAAKRCDRAAFDAALAEMRAARREVRQLEKLANAAGRYSAAFHAHFEYYKSSFDAQIGEVEALRLGDCAREQPAGEGLPQTAPPTEIAPGGDLPRPKERPAPPPEPGTSIFDQLDDFYFPAPKPRGSPPAEGSAPAMPDPPAEQGAAAPPPPAGDPAPAADPPPEPKEQWQARPRKPRPPPPEPR